MKGIENLTTRIDKIDSKFELFETRLSNLEKTFDDQINQLDKKLETKVDYTVLENFNLRLQNIEQQQITQKTEDIMQESYDKRLNLLIHGIEESDAWETLEKTKKLLHNFMKDDLLIDDPSTIFLADYHRLPQQPIFRNNRKVHRPIIIKLTNSTDKRLSFTKLKNLKKYNEIKKSVDKQPHYITEHLPKQFQQERKAVLSQFKEAKRMKKKVSWRAENCHYCLYVNNVKVIMLKAIFALSLLLLNSKFKYWDNLCIIYLVSNIVNYLVVF